jgi:hypothetical protein
MEIEGYDSIISSIVLAKKLHEIDRDDIVQQHFFDTLSWDSYIENIMGVLMSIFSGFYSDYDDSEEDEIMIFTDDYISRYYEIAWKYGRKHNIRHEENPYVIEAENEVARTMSFCFSAGWKLLGYTKTKRNAKKSKLIVCIGTCDCDCHGSLAHALIRLYQWFSDKCAEYDKQTEVLAA